MSTVVVHLPQGFPRTKRLRDQPLLSGLPYHILTLLLDPDETDDRTDLHAHGWTQVKVARRLGVTMHAVKKAFRALKQWGYWLPCRRVLGRERVLHWWFVTDEPGEFGEPEQRMERDYLAALNPNTEVTSGVDQQPMKADPETPCSSREDKGNTPLPPVVGKSSTPGSPQRPRRSKHGRLARKQKSRKRLSAAALPAHLEPWALKATQMAHDLQVPPLLRVEVASYLAYLLAVGYPENDLMLEFSKNMGTAQDVGRCVRYRTGMKVELHAQAHGHDWEFPHGNRVRRQAR